MECEICGIEVGGWSARYEGDVTHCKKCFGSDEAKTLIENKQPEEMLSKSGSVQDQEDSLDYKTAISIAKFISAVGWVFSIIAIILVLFALGNSRGFAVLAIAPGLGVFVGGLVLVITGQASRAVMDNANYSKLMLEEMRKKN